jgi:hypothetical protein
MNEMDQSYPPDIVLDVEQILVTLIKEFPMLPPQYRGFATEAFLASASCQNIDRVIFQGKT